MSGTDDDRPNPKVWGRRAYAGKRARELLNDISRYIARTQPDDVDDPTDPSLTDILRHADDAMAAMRDPDSEDEKAATLACLMSEGLDFQEAVCWYWFRFCRYDITEIHFAMTGKDTGGDPDQRRNSVRNILRVLKSAASKLPDEDPADIGDQVDERKRHDRTDEHDDDSSD